VGALACSEELQTGSRCRIMGRQEEKFSGWFMVARYNQGFEAIRGSQCFTRPGPSPSGAGPKGRRSTHAAGVVW